ncbi:MAG: RagB/SusD family nutrient uptake outer membrane protein [Bacteroidetes bacterium]|nr:RagB/SusD family nutrient uptake outer membrane protein [Bacteroidota bacterium]MBS1539604.1 RagB/SusD family nutrient uptake outer membrane protein [Bacteroidota bacterium]
MKKRILSYSLSVLMVALATTSCTEQLEKLQNPNAPTLIGNINNEAGLINLFKGATWIDGFVYQMGWLGDSYFSLPYSYAELNADVIGAQSSNQNISNINLPISVTPTGGGPAFFTNSTPQTQLIRTFNTRAFTGAGENVTYYQWSGMYTLNNSMNWLLPLIPTIHFTGNAADKKNTYKAWCYFWKGYAYAAIGSQYCAGLIFDKYKTDNNAFTTNNNYVTQDVVIAQSNLYYDSAAATIQTISNTDNASGSPADYYNVLSQLIPAFFQVGQGQVPSGAEWRRTINTMKARNILVNKLAPYVNGSSSATISNALIPAMTAADWAAILTLCDGGNGIQQGDNCFTGRSTTLNPIYTTLGGTTSALTIGPTESNTFQITERFVQNYKPGDARFTNNFPVEPDVWSNGIFSVRYRVEPNGLGAPGVVNYGSFNDGAYQLYMVSSYEENALMIAEAKIQTGDIDGGLAIVDQIRTYQGAGIAAVSGTGLTKDQALGELTRERRVALLFRGVSYYDSRRWGWTYSIASGGGGYNLNYLDDNDVIQTGTFDYSFMDYWDVPADEIVLNPPSGSSAPVKNPKF